MKFGEYMNESLAAEIKSEPKSAAAGEAKKLGLTYGGFGRYLNKEGAVTHIVHNGKLVPFKGQEEVTKEYNKLNSTETTNTSKKNGDAGKSKELKKSLDTTTKVLQDREHKDVKSIYKIQTDGLKVDKALVNHHKNLFNSMDPNYVTAIQQYTTLEYQAINRYLYKGHDEGAVAKRDKQIVDLINAIDTVMDEAEAPFPYTVYTGLGDKYTSKNLVSGENYIFRGYISTTLDPMLAIERFADSKSDEKIVFQIDIAGGQKALHVSGISTVGSEQETILPRGSVIQVISGPHPFTNSVLPDTKSKTLLYHCIVVQEDEDDD